MIRSKGLIWTDSDHEFAKEWASAGSSMGLNPGRRWQDEPSEEKYRDRRFGDRRQELVFIGQSMKETEIRKALDDALLSELEFATQLKSWYPEARDESRVSLANTPAAKKARTDA